MYIQDLKISTIVETDCPLTPITDLLKDKIYSRVSKTSYIDSACIADVVSCMTLDIIIKILILSVIPISYGLFLLMLTSTTLPHEFTFMNPQHMFRFILLISITFTCTPLVWLVYSNKLNNCIYSYLIAKFAVSFYKYRMDDTSRDMSFTHYLKCASKEWNYYDHIDKL